MTDVAARWYPDPAGGTGQRWWDGTRWTEFTSPMVQGASSDYAGVVTTGAAPYGQAGYGHVPATTTGYQPAPQYGQPQYGQPQYGQPQYGQPQYGQPQYGQPQYGHAVPAYRTPTAAQGSLFARNRHTTLAVCVSLAYLLIAILVHVVFLGIVPVLAAVRAFRAGEKVAVLGAVAAGLAVVISLALR